jgi:hypothetical protein
VLTRIAGQLQSCTELKAAGAARVMAEPLNLPPAAAVSGTICHKFDWAGRKRCMTFSKYQLTVSHGLPMHASSDRLSRTFGAG